MCEREKKDRVKEKDKQSKRIYAYSDWFYIYMRVVLRRHGIKNILQSQRSVPIINADLE